MNIYSRAKWLQYLSKKNENQGNVLVAVLVVLIIIGVLVAMAFPSAVGVLVAMAFPSDRCCRDQPNRNAEIITAGRSSSQNFYYLEDGAFVDSMPKFKNKNHEYFARATKTAVFTYAIAQKTASEPLKSYVGAIFLVSSSRLEKKKLRKKIKTLGIVCETSFSTSDLPAVPTYKNGVLACGRNTKKVDYSSYVGALFVEGKSETPATRGEMNIVSIVCTANTPGVIKHVEPAYQNGEVACGSNARISHRYLNPYEYPHLH